MINENLFFLSTLLYFLLLILISFIEVLRKRYLFHSALAIFLVHTLSLVVRWIESHEVGYGHAPLSNYYESLVFFAWCITFVTLFLIKRVSIPLLSFFSLFGSFVIMAYANLSPSVERSIKPLVPALQSNWLYFHVFTCFMAYAAFFLSFLCGIFYFVYPKGFFSKNSFFEELNQKLVSIGFVFLTFGILSGSVWAHYAWGSYWSWDPKETWSLITWIVYAVFLHGRYIKGWKGKKLAVLSIIGFISVLFTYFGVNFLLSGLHSYAA